MPNGDVLSHFATEYSETQLVMRPNMTRVEWMELGDILHKIERGVKWWLGDWWLYGERKYGEGAAQAADVGQDLHTLQNAAWVASRVEPSRRREDLSHSHHEAVAKLEPEEQDRWLDKAAGSGMNVHQLRAHIRADANGGDTTSETVKLLRRAAYQFRRDNPDECSLGEFVTLAEGAWQDSLDGVT